MANDDIFKKVDRLREQKIEYKAIEKLLIEEGIESEKVGKTISYARNEEKTKLYVLSQEYDDFSYLGKKLFYITGLFLGILLLGLSVYFFVKFVQVVKTPDVIRRDNMIILINGLWKGKLSVSLILLAIFILFGSLAITSYSLKYYRESKDKRKEYLKFKLRQ